MQNIKEPTTKGCALIDLDGAEETIRIALAEQHRNTRHKLAEMFMEMADQLRDTECKIPDPAVTSLHSMIMNCKQTAPSVVLPRIFEETSKPIKDLQQGDRVTIPAAEVTFNAGGNTIWINAPNGSTIMRIKSSGNIVEDACGTSPFSHVDIMTENDILFCLSEDAIIP